jgi:glycosyltransferase involved in cell wall biosynthesis
MKIFVALGPGDIVAAHRAQIKGGPIASETSIIFSGQLLEFCRERGIETLALSHNRRVDSLRDGLLQIENRPRLLDGRGSVRYHLSMITYAMYLATRAFRFGPDLALVDSGSAHYFALALFRMFGIPVAINFHNTLWPNGFEPKRRLAQLIRALDAWFFRSIAAGAIGCSPECGKQVQQLSGPKLPFLEYRTQFRNEEFNPRRGDHDRNPFRVIFIGRIERNKGALDVPAMAEKIRERSNIPILFEICGGGSALFELKQTVKEKRLADIVLVHGRLPRSELFQLYARANAVVVPTRSDFCEGLPAVCAEAVLFGLPIITSRLSNALPVLGAALLEVEPENIESYVNAIVKLTEDRTTYHRLSNACPALSRQFLDRSQSYPAAVDRLIARLFPGWKALNNYEPLFARVG